MTIARSFSRRKFLQIAGGALGAGVLAANKALAVISLPLGETHVRIYRKSVRGRRGSQAAKSAYANLRFATKKTAEEYVVHAGDHSRVVALDVSLKEYLRLFQGGRKVIDLRHI